MSPVDVCRALYSFFFNDTATTEIYTLSLHDALPIFGSFIGTTTVPGPDGGANAIEGHLFPEDMRGTGEGSRSEEHTSELQSHLNLVCRLLLEKKKPTAGWNGSGSQGSWLPGID